MMNKRNPKKIVKTVLFALVLREIRGRFGAKRMGAFWFIFEPLAHIVLLIFFFWIIRGRALPGIDYPTFVVTGIVPFLLFKNIVLKGMDAVSANQGLFAYRQIKPFDCILARLIVEFFLMACIYIVILSALGIWGRMDVTIHHPLKWFAMLAVGIIFSFSLALISCVIAELLPEVKTFIKLLFMPLYFLSAVIWPIWLIPKPLAEWMLWNPFLHIIDSLRSAVFPHYILTPEISWWFTIEASLVTLLVGMMLYRSFRREIVAI